MKKKIKVIFLSILNVALIILIGYMYRWRFSLSTLVEDYCKAYNVKECKVSTIIDDGFRHKLVVIETDSHYSSISVETLRFIHRQVDYDSNIKIPFVGNNLYNQPLGLQWFPKNENSIIRNYSPNNNQISFYQSDDSFPRLESVSFETLLGENPSIKRSSVTASMIDDHIFTYKYTKSFDDQDALFYYYSPKSDKFINLSNYASHISDGDYFEILDSKDRMMKYYFIPVEYTEENYKLRLLSSLHALRGTLANVDTIPIKENHELSIISKYYNYNNSGHDQPQGLQSDYNKYYFHPIDGGALILETSVINNIEYDNQVFAIIDSEYLTLKEIIGFESE
ncbi:MAG: hypothetical protein RR565_09190 [Erysipelothrix sp.]